MQSVTLGLTLLDLTPTVAHIVEEDFGAKLRERARFQNKISSGHHGMRLWTWSKYDHPKSSHAYMASLRHVLNNCWEEKLHFARSAFQGLEELRVGFSLVFGVMVLRGRNENGLIGHHSGCPISSITGSELHQHQYRPGDPSHGDIYQSSILRLLARVAHRTASLVEPKISEMGWQEFKKPVRLESIVAARKQETQRNYRATYLTETGLQLMTEEQHGGL